MKQVRTIKMSPEEAVKILARFVSKKTGGKVEDAGWLDETFRFVLEEEDFEDVHED